MAAALIEPVDGVYVTPRGRRLAAESVSWLATRSGGPGGQHANTSDTAVTIAIDVGRTGLPEVVRSRIEAAVGATVVATSAKSRSQWRNRQLAWQEAMMRLDEAAAPPPPPRARTRPSRGAREARLR
ncbi:MAG: peptide chain release factor-like protein, partial [Actinomycetota bacterium]|nr:peptide chain release factor-like protein [Actinomycetota bacterium]